MTALRSDSLGARAGESVGAPSTAGRPWPAASPSSLGCGAGADYFSSTSRHALMTALSMVVTLTCAPSPCCSGDGVRYRDARAPGRVNGPLPRCPSTSHVVLLGLPLHVCVVVLVVVGAGAVVADLSGLPYRRCPAVGLHAALAAVPAGARLGVLCLDIDGSTPINDELGHAAGDALLVRIAAQQTTGSGRRR